MRRYLLTALLFFLLLSPAFGQVHNTVELGSPVYKILDNAVQRGILPILPSARPYSKLQVLSYLYEMKEMRNKLTPRELVILDSYIEKYSVQVQPSWKNASVGGQGNFGSIALGFYSDGEFRLNVNAPSNWYMHTAFFANLKGDISSWLSFNTAFGVTGDRVTADFTYGTNIDGATISGTPPYAEGALQGGTYTLGSLGVYAPYHFTKQWNGYHLTLSKHITAEVSDELSGAFTFMDEINTSFFNNNLIFRVANVRREWGQGDGSLTLSGTARPFEGVEEHIRFAKWINLSFCFGSLGNWFIDSAINDDDDDDVSEQKMLTIQTLEFFPLKWLYFSFTSEVIWGKRFEIGYMNPLILSLYYQNNHGDFDNIGISATAAGIIPFAGKVYGSFFLDEIQFSGPKDPRNILAYQLGIATSVPLLPFTTIKLQYTKLEPFVYAHYSEKNYPYYNNPVSMSFTNDGENLAYYLPPNSDEILLKIETVPMTGLSASLAYKLLRHGTNSFAGGEPIGGYIYGDINIPLNYSYWDNYGYPKKDFLHDGIYDWTHMIDLCIEYQFPRFPAKIGFEYVFSYTFWDPNDTGITPPDPVIQNIFALTYTIFR